MGIHYCGVFGVFPPEHCAEDREEDKEGKEQKKTKPKGKTQHTESPLGSTEGRILQRFVICWPRPLTISIATSRPLGCCRLCDVNNLSPYSDSDMARIPTSLRYLPSLSDTASFTDIGREVGVVPQSIRGIPGYGGQQQQQQQPGRSVSNRLPNGKPGMVEVR